MRLPAGHLPSSCGSTWFHSGPPVSPFLPAHSLGLILKQPCQFSSSLISPQYALLLNSPGVHLCYLQLRTVLDTWVFNMQKMRWIWTWGEGKEAGNELGYSAEGHRENRGVFHLRKRREKQWESGGKKEKITKQHDRVVKGTFKNRTLVTSIQFWVICILLLYNSYLHPAKQPAKSDTFTWVLCEWRFLMGIKEGGGPMGTRTRIEYGKHWQFINQTNKGAGEDLEMIGKALSYPYPTPSLKSLPRLEKMKSSKRDPDQKEMELSP